MAAELEKGERKEHFQHKGRGGPGSPGNMMDQGYSHKEGLTVPQW
jgi:hypothetical protein